MSGIAGIILKNPNNKNYFKKTIFEMAKLIRHRGPHKQGFLEFEGLYSWKAPVPEFVISVLDETCPGTTVEL